MTWFKRAGGAGGDGIGADFQPDAFESSLRWQVIWPRVIARAWTDAVFHAAVLNNPRKAIMDYFGYELSGNLNLTVKDAEEDDAFQDDVVDPADPWSKLPPLELTVVIPPPPAAQLQAVAITAYQDTGRTYPFTCC